MSPGPPVGKAGQLPRGWRSKNLQSKGCQNIYTVYLRQGSLKIIFIHDKGIKCGGGEGGGVGMGEGGLSLQVDKKT